VAANQNHGISEYFLYKKTTKYYHFTGYIFFICLIFDKISTAQPCQTKMLLYWTCKTHKISMATISFCI